MKNFLLCITVLLVGVIVFSLIKLLFTICLLIVIGCISYVLIRDIYRKGNSLRH
jgi:hypothetical protein